MRELPLLMNGAMVRGRSPLGKSVALDPIPRSRTSERSLHALRSSSHPNGSDAPHNHSDKRQHANHEERKVDPVIQRSSRVISARPHRHIDDEKSQVHA